MEPLSFLAVLICPIVMGGMMLQQPGNALRDGEDGQR